MKMDIEDLKDRLDVLEGTTITSINQQIFAISTSISDLKDMDEALDAYIKTLEETATNLQSQIDETNAEIAKLEAEFGEEIDALEQNLLNELNAAKESILAELTAINKTLGELKAADEALDKKISDLQAYVDVELSSIKDWVNTTFSTLAQYELMQTEISTIKALIEQMNAGMIALETRLDVKITADIQAAIDTLRSELSDDYVARIESAVSSITHAYSTAISTAKSEITAAYTEAIATAIRESEASLKDWVNEQLVKGYYDIATIDAMLYALSVRLDNADSDLQKQISDQQAALEALKSEFTKAYMSAIKEAIEENNGVISAAIASAVNELEGNLQKQIDAINLQIRFILDSLSDLEDAFVNRIQSLRFIPEFSDRKVKFSYQSGAVLDFMVAPEKQASALAEAWNADKNIVKAYLRYTSDPSTRAVCDPIELAVESVTSNGKGDISVLIKENPDTPLSSDFWNDNQDAVVYLRISDGSNDVISELIDVVGYTYPAMNLSQNGTANSYVVSGVGKYKFAAVKGNSSESAGSIASAEVIWESFGTLVTPSVGDLVKSVSYKDGDITFNTADSFKEGNAVIAVKDASDNILWSWHIWFTEEPQEQVYYNNAGTMMDRNLGATSAVPGEVGAIGLMYQWGRKDPFLNSPGFSTPANSTILWPSTVSSDSGHGTIGYATANPTTFIASNSINDDWYYTGDSSTDDTRWTTSETTKSIYDPCPVGWRIPDDVWSRALGLSGNNYLYGSFDKTNKGMDFSAKLGDDTVIWYPATGLRFNGLISGVGTVGTYWSASSMNYMLYFNNDSSVSLSNGDRSEGCSVRCVKE